MAAAKTTTVLSVNKQPPPPPHHHFRGQFNIIGYDCVVQSAMRHEFIMRLHPAEMDRFYLSTGHQNPQITARSGSFTPEDQEKPLQPDDQVYATMLIETPTDNQQPTTYFAQNAYVTERNINIIKDQTACIQINLNAANIMRAHFWLKEALHEATVGKHVFTSAPPANMASGDFINFAAVKVNNTLMPRPCPYVVTRATIISDEEVHKTKSFQLQPEG